MNGVNGLEITDVKVKKLNGLGRLVGEASITLNNCFVVHNLKIIQLDNKKMVAFPSRKKVDGKFEDIAHPINSEFRNYVENYIFEIFNKNEVSE